MPRGNGRMLIRDIRPVPENRRREGGAEFLTLDVERPYFTTAEQFAEELDYLMEQYLSTESPKNGRNTS